MEDRHLTLDLLRAIHGEVRNPGDLVPVAMAHLFELCPHCRRVFESWRCELGEGVADPSLVQYDAAFDRVEAQIRGEAASIPSPSGRGSSDVGLDRALAQQRVSELLELSPAERSARLRAQPDRYTGTVLADLLLAEAHGHLPARPKEAYSVAGLARAVLQHVPTSCFAGELYARALAHQANAVRALGELRRADELFEVARFLLKSQGDGHDLARAELDSFEGSLRRAQRRFDEAQSLLNRSAMTYALAGRNPEAARALLRLGMTYEEMGDPERAIESTLQACDLIQELEDPDLELIAKHNLAHMLQEAGQTAEAREIMSALSPLYDRLPDPLIQLRRLWLEADIDHAEGKQEAAEANYKAVRDGFLAHGIGYEAALAALDLALLYAEQGRTAELKRVAEEIVPVFESQDVHREAATALMLFQDAVRTEQVTLRYLIELSRYLQRARHDPTLAFHTPT